MTTTSTTAFVTPHINEVRKRAWHYLNYEVATCAGMYLDQLVQFVAGTFVPSDEQLYRLARRMQFDKYPA